MLSLSSVIKKARENDITESQFPGFLERQGYFLLPSMADSIDSFVLALLYFNKEYKKKSVFLEQSDQLYALVKKERKTARTRNKSRYISRLFKAKGNLYKLYYSQGCIVSKSLKSQSQPTENDSYIFEFDGKYAAVCSLKDIFNDDTAYALKIHSLLCQHQVVGDYLIAFLEHDSTTNVENLDEGKTQISEEDSGVSSQPQPTDVISLAYDSLINMALFLQKIRVSAARNQTPKSKNESGNLKDKLDEVMKDIVSMDSFFQIYKEIFKEEEEGCFYIYEFSLIEKKLPKELLGSLLHDFKIAMIDSLIKINVDAINSKEKETREKIAQKHAMEAEYESTIGKKRNDYERIKLSLGLDEILSNYKVVKLLDDKMIHKNLIDLLGQISDTTTWEEVCEIGKVNKIFLTIKDLCKKKSIRFSKQEYVNLLIKKLKPVVNCYKVSKISDEIIEIDCHHLSVAALLNHPKFKQEIKFSEIKINATGMVYLDENIKLPSRNVIVVADKIDVVEKITIDLSGEDAKECAESKARSGTAVRLANNASQTDDDVEGKHGENGEHGAAGFSSGNLSLSGELLHGNNLTIKVNGGNGAKGQAGGDGEKGKKGDRGKDGEYKDNSSSHFKFWWWAEIGDGRPGKSGLKGGNGGHGGLGGEGGYPGRVIIREKELTKGKKTNIDAEDNQYGITIEYKRGVIGDYGDNGKGGKGGDGGDRGFDVGAEFYGYLLDIHKADPVKGRKLAYEENKNIFGIRSRRLYEVKSAPLLQAARGREGHVAQLLTSEEKAHNKAEKIHFHSKADVEASHLYDRLQREKTTEDNKILEKEIEGLEKKKKLSESDRQRLEQDIVKLSKIQAELVESGRNAKKQIIQQYSQAEQRIAVHRIQRYAEEINLESHQKRSSPDTSEEYTIKSKKRQRTREYAGAEEDVESAAPTNEISSDIKTFFDVLMVMFDSGLTEKDNQYIEYTLAMLMQKEKLYKDIFLKHNLKAYYFLIIIRLCEKITGITLQNHQINQLVKDEQIKVSNRGIYISQDDARLILQNLSDDMELCCLLLKHNLYNNSKLCSIFQFNKNVKLPVQIYQFHSKFAGTVYGPPNWETFINFAVNSDATLVELLLEALERQMLHRLANKQFMGMGRTEKLIFIPIFEQFVGMYKEGKQKLNNEIIACLVLRIDYLQNFERHLDNEIKGKPHEFLDANDVDNFRINLLTSLNDYRKCQKKYLSGRRKRYVEHDVAAIFDEIVKRIYAATAAAKTKVLIKDLCLVTVVLLEALYEPSELYDRYILLKKLQMEINLTPAAIENIKTQIHQKFIAEYLMPPILEIKSRFASIVSQENMACNLDDVLDMLQSEDSDLSYYERMQYCHELLALESANIQAGINDIHYKVWGLSSELVILIEPNELQYGVDLATEKFIALVNHLLSPSYRENFKVTLKHEINDIRFLINKSVSFTDHKNTADVIEKLFALRAKCRGRGEVENLEHSILLDKLMRKVLKEYQIYIIDLYGLSETGEKLSLFFKAINRSAEYFSGKNTVKNVSKRLSYLNHAYHLCKMLQDRKEESSKDIDKWIDKFALDVLRLESNVADLRTEMRKRLAGLANLVKTECDLSVYKQELGLLNMLLIAHSDYEVLDEMATILDSGFSHKDIGTVERDFLEKNALIFKENLVLRHKAQFNGIDQHCLEDKGRLLCKDITNVRVLEIISNAGLLNVNDQQSKIISYLKEKSFEKMQAEAHNFKEKYIEMASCILTERELFLFESILRDKKTFEKVEEIFSYFQLTHVSSWYSYLQKIQLDIYYLSFLSKCNLDFNTVALEMRPFKDRVDFGMDNDIQSIFTQFLYDNEKSELILNKLESFLRDSFDAENATSIYHFKQALDKIIEFQIILNESFYLAQDGKCVGVWYDLISMLITEFCVDKAKSANGIKELSDFLELLAYAENLESVVLVMSSTIPESWLERVQICIMLQQIEIFLYNDEAYQSRMEEIINEISTTLNSIKNKSFMMPLLINKVSQENILLNQASKISYEKLKYILQTLSKLTLTSAQYKALEDKPITLWASYLKAQMILKKLSLPSVSNILAGKIKAVVNQLLSHYDLILFENFIDIFLEKQKAEDVNYEELYALLVNFTKKDYVLNEITLEELKKINVHHWGGYFSGDYGERASEVYSLNQLAKQLTLELNQSGERSTPVPNEGTILKNIGEIKDNYEKMDIYNEKDDFEEWCEALNKKKKDNPGCWLDENIHEIIAVIMRAVKLIYGFEPYDTQLIALWLWYDAARHNQGRLGQVATGEGKTIIIVMFAILQTLQGKKANIITSSSVLAIRDAKMNAKIYDWFGFTVSNNCDRESQKDIEARRKRYDAPIVYGEIGNFQQDYLLTYSLGIEVLGNRKNEIIIADEVDSMLLDKSENTLYLSHNIVDLRYLRRLYVEIWVAVHRFGYDQFEHEEELINDCIKQIKLKIEADEICIPKFLTKFVNYRLPRWVKSAIRARDMKENTHFIVDKKTEKSHKEDIIIMDTGTGVEQVNMHWSDGLHQFLELSCTRKLSSESLKAVFKSNLSYFQDHRGRVYGITGTLGTKADKDLLTHVYQVDFFQLPRRKTHLFTRSQGCVLQKQDDWMKKIKHRVSYCIKKEEGRAVLIICITVSQVNKLEEYLSQKPSVNCYSYKSSFDEFLYENQEVKPGDVIVATNLAGRGTDLKISKELEKNGGLHVILTYMPDNVRVEDQAFGRAARKGQVGSGEYILVDNEGRSIHEMRLARNELTQKKATYFREFTLQSIDMEEKLFVKFTELYKSIRAQLKSGKTKKHPDYYIEIQLKSLRDHWAFWLDEIEDKIRFATDNSQEVFKNYDRFEQEIRKKLNSEGLHRLVSTPHELSRLGREYLSRRKYKEASGCFDEVVRSNPDHCEAALLYQVKVAYENGKKHDYAMRKKIKFTLNRLKKLITKRINDDLLTVNITLKIVRSLIKGSGVGFHGNDFELQLKNEIILYSAHLQVIESALNSPITPNLFDAVDRSRSKELSGNYIEVLNKKRDIVKPARINSKIRLEKTNSDWKLFVDGNEGGRLIEFPTALKPATNQMLQKLSDIHGSNNSGEEKIENLQKSLSAVMLSRDSMWEQLQEHPQLMKDVKMHYRINAAKDMLKNLDFPPSFPYSVEEIKKILIENNKKFISIDMFTRLYPFPYDVLFTSLKEQGIVYQISSAKITLTANAESDELDLPEALMVYRNVLEDFLAKKNIRLQSGAKIEHEIFDEDILLPKTDEEAIVAMMELFQKEEIIRPQRINLSLKSIKDSKKHESRKQEIQKNILKLLKESFGDQSKVYKEKVGKFIGDLMTTEDGSLDWSEQCKAVKECFMKSGLPADFKALTSKSLKKLIGIKDTKESSKQFREFLNETKKELELELEKLLKNGELLVDKNINALIENGVGKLRYMPTMKVSFKPIEILFKENPYFPEIDDFKDALLDQILIFSEVPPTINQDALWVGFIGALQIIAGLAIELYIVGIGSAIGAAVIAQGINDIILAVSVQCGAPFSWKSYAISKSITSVISLLSVGYSTVYGATAATLQVSPIGSAEKMVLYAAKRLALEGAKAIGSYGAVLTMSKICQILQYELKNNFSDNLDTFIYSSDRVKKPLLELEQTIRKIMTEAKDAKHAKAVIERQIKAILWATTGESYIKAMKDEMFPLIGDISTYLIYQITNSNPLLISMGVSALMSFIDGCAKYQQVLKIIPSTLNELNKRLQNEYKYMDKRLAKKTISAKKQEEISTIITSLKRSLRDIAVEKFSNEIAKQNLVKYAQMAVNTVSNQVFKSSNQEFRDRVQAKVLDIEKSQRETGLRVHSIGGRNRQSSRGHPRVPVGMRRKPNINLARGAAVGASQSGRGRASSSEVSSGVSRSDPRASAIRGRMSRIGRPRIGREFARITGMNIDGVVLGNRRPGLRVAPEYNVVRSMRGFLSHRQHFVREAGALRTRNAVSQSGMRTQVGVRTNIRTPRFIQTPLARRQKHFLKQMCRFLQESDHAFENDMATLHENTRNVIMNTSLVVVRRIIVAQIEKDIALEMQKYQSEWHERLQPYKDNFIKHYNKRIADEKKRLVLNIALIIVNKKLSYLGKSFGMGSDEILSQGEVAQEEVNKQASDILEQCLQEKEVRAQYQILENYLNGIPDGIGEKKAYDILLNSLNKIKQLKKRRKEMGDSEIINFATNKEALDGLTKITTNFRDCNLSDAGYLLNSGQLGIPGYISSIALTGIMGCVEKGHRLEQKKLSIAENVFNSIATIQKSHMQLSMELLKEHNKYVRDVRLNIAGMMNRICQLQDRFLTETIKLDKDIQAENEKKFKAINERKDELYMRLEATSNATVINLVSNDIEKLQEKRENLEKLGQERHKPLNLIIVEINEKLKDIREFLDKMLADCKEERKDFIEHAKCMNEAALAGLDGVRDFVKLMSKEASESFGKTMSAVSLKEIGSAAADSVKGFAKNVAGTVAEEWKKRSQKRKNDEVVEPAENDRETKKQSTAAGPSK